MACTIMYCGILNIFIKLLLYYHLIPSFYHGKNSVFSVRDCLKKHPVFLVRVHHHAGGREMSQSKHGYSTSLQLNLTGCRKSSDEVISCHWCNLRCSLFPLGKLWGSIRKGLVSVKLYFTRIWCWQGLN